MWPVFVCFFVMENMEGGWQVWTSLSSDGVSQEFCWHLSAGSATNIAMLGSLSRLNINSSWCWGHIPDSPGCWCLRYCSEIKLESSHSSDFKQLCTKSMKAGHSTCSVLASLLNTRNVFCWSVQALREQSVPWGQWDPHPLSEGLMCPGFPLPDNDQSSVFQFQYFSLSLQQVFKLFKSYSKSDVWCENEGTDTAKFGLLRLTISTVAQTRTENAAECLITSKTLFSLNQNHVGSRKVPSFVSRSYISNRFTLG